MNYFEYHLGDYAKDAGHLTMLRDGAYLRLMAVYYSREKPLPLDLEECFDLTRCTTRAEREAVEYVLKKFFTREEDGYRQKRCDEELERYRAKSEAGKTGANARWSQNGRNANGMRSHMNGNAPNPNPNPNPNSNPLPPFEKGAVSRRRSPERAEKDAALAVWDQLIATDGAQPPRDPGLQAVIDSLGGWSRIQQRKDGADSNTLKKQFCDAYRDHAP